MGKKSGGSSGSNSATKAAAEAQLMLANLAKKYYEETAPLRQGMFDELGLLFDPYSAGGSLANRMSMLPGYGLGKQTIEGQYDMAKENLLAALPQGGTIGQAMTDLETSRAGELTSLLSGLYEDRLNKAYGVATGSPQVAFGGLSSAAGGLGNLGIGQLNAAAQNRASQMGLYGDLGSALGFVLGSSLMGPAGAAGGAAGGKKGGRSTGSKK